MDHVVIRWLTNQVDRCKLRFGYVAIDDRKVDQLFPYDQPGSYYVDFMFVHVHRNTIKTMFRKITSSWLITVSLRPSLIAISVTIAETSRTARTILDKAHSSQIPFLSFEHLRFHWANVLLILQKWWTKVIHRWCSGEEVLVEIRARLSLMSRSMKLPKVETARLSVRLPRSVPRSKTDWAIRAYSVSTWSIIRGVVIRVPWVLQVFMKYFDVYIPWVTWYFFIFCYLGLLYSSYNVRGTCALVHVCVRTCVHVCTRLYILYIIFILNIYYINSRSLRSRIYYIKNIKNGVSGARVCERVMWAGVCERTCPRVRV